MKAAAIIVFCAALSACVAQSFNLGSVTNSQGQDKETMQKDWDACREQAHAQARSGMSGIKTNLLAASVVGYQAGVDNEIAANRAAFRTCMEARGYTYTAPKD